MRRRLLFALLIAAALAGPAAAQAQAQAPDPVPPVATTAAATNLALTSATVGGTVDANGSATTWYVEYGTTTTYGLRTTTRDAGAGDDPVTVSAALAGLTSDTTYHFRVVATNAAGTARGADRSLRTTRPANPLPPVVSTGAVGALAPTAATLTGSVNARGTATRWRFDWGTGTSLNRHTAYAPIGGAAAVAVSTPLALAPNTRYSYRIYATNAAGTARGARRSFTTPRAQAALSMAVQSNRVPYGATAVVTGTATSAGTGGVPLVLERQFFPFTGPFERIASKTSAARGGAFTFTVSSLLLSARLRVVAQTAPPVTSLARTVRTTVRVSIAHTRRPGRRVRFTGTVSPALSGARASLQRRKGGRFVTLRRVQLRPPGAATRSSYRITIAARRAAAYYRVIVTPAAASGHARGASNVHYVGALRRG